MLIKLTEKVLLLPPHLVSLIRAPGLQSWLTVTQEWCCRTHPIGLKGGCSRASNIPWHKGQKQRGGFMLPQPKQGFFVFFLLRYGFILSAMERRENPSFYCCKVCLKAFDIFPGILKCGLHLIVFIVVHFPNFFNTDEVDYTLSNQLG